MVVKVWLAPGLPAGMVDYKQARDFSIENGHLMLWSEEIQLIASYSPGYWCGVAIVQDS